MAVDRIHMLKERSGMHVTTRCNLVIKMKTAQRIGDVGVSGWEDQVTCPNCALPVRDKVIRRKRRRVMV